jgi:hypothetical protein
MKMDFFLVFLLTVSALRRVLEKDGLSVENVAGDRNCMYRAISNQLSNNGTIRSWREVKNDILNFMRENPNSKVGKPKHA